MNKVCFPACALVLTMLTAGYCAGGTVIIAADREISPVNSRVFGNNFIGYDPNTYEDWGKPYNGYSDFGAGLWDPDNKRPMPEVIDLAKQAGITAARFPGGCGSHRYDWKRSVGKGRTSFLYGIDEFLQTCKEIGAEPVFTMSFFLQDARDAAALAEYLNDPARPLRVRYVEFGNEDWHGDHRSIKSVEPEDYARKYLVCYDAIKAVAPDIHIGVILSTPDWNRRVMSRIKDKIDFGILHLYPTAEARMWRLMLMKPSEIFGKTLAEPAGTYEPILRHVRDQLHEAAGRSVPLAVTEYNAGFIQDQPVPYRHSLGAALVNAEMLRIFMRPGSGIMMAHYWQFCNSYWGMVFETPQGYVKRPNFYVYEMYKRYFGATLVGVTVTAPDLSVNTSISGDGRTVCAMIVNKNMEAPVSADIIVQGFPCEDSAQVSILNADRVDATNETQPHRVGLREARVNGTGNTFGMTFEPHSLTAVIFSKRSL